MPKRGKQGKQETQSIQPDDAAPSEGLGEVAVTRELKRRSKTLGADQGAVKIPVEADDPLDSEVTFNIGHTMQTQQYENLRVDVGGRLPCTAEAFRNGEAYKELSGICRRELADQLARGTRGLK